MYIYEFKELLGEKADQMGIHMPHKVLAAITDLIQYEFDITDDNVHEIISAICSRAKLHYRHFNDDSLNVLDPLIQRTVRFIENSQLEIFGKGHLKSTMLVQDAVTLTVLSTKVSPMWIDDDSYEILFNLAKSSIKTFVAFITSVHDIVDKRIGNQEV